MPPNTAILGKVSPPFLLYERDRGEGWAMPYDKTLFNLDNAQFARTILATTLGLVSFYRSQI